MTEQQEMKDNRSGLMATLASPAVWPVAGFTLAYMVVALIASLRGHSGEFLLYFGVMVVLVAVVAIVHLRVGLQMGTRSQC